jgi:hypothetical protein
MTHSTAVNRDSKYAYDERAFVQPTALVRENVKT